jgi:membrane protein DedA with SNARE-associated domain
MAGGGRELVEHLLQSIPPLAVYLIVGLVIMVESLGIPVPGEITLVSAAVLTAQHKLAASPEWIAACASAGAIAGDSVGYLIGRRAGRPLFGWLGHRFPAHFGPRHVVLAERVFTAHGAWAVFSGRFIAVLRIFAGPLAGALKMPYGRFLAANAAGGIAWAAGITYLIWFLGVAAEGWLSRLSWLGLIAAAAAGLVISLLVRKKVRRLARHSEAQPPTGPGRAEAGQEHAWQGHPSGSGTGERAATASRP